MLHVPGLYIGRSDLGDRGVFVAHSLEAKDIIEVCPVILLRKEHVALIDKTHLFNYYFIWPDKRGSICFALGYGSLYNHSREPNARTIMDLETNEIIIEAIKPIMDGEEILIDYLDGAKRGTELWFDEK